MQRPHLISVITAVHPGRTQWLHEAWSSLCQQPLPRGWAFEWLVQEDGPPTLGGMVRAMTSEDTRVAFAANGGHHGAAATRNAALQRARGTHLATLDADDAYAPGALRALVLALQRFPGAAWVAGRTVYLRAGVEQPYPDRLVPGVVVPGTLATDWLLHRRPAAHPAAFLVSMEAIRAAGGWMPLSGSEDTGMLITVGETTRGVAIDAVVLRYRKWPEQTTATVEWRARHAADQEVILRHIAGLRSRSK